MNWLDFGIYMIERSFLAVRIDKTMTKKSMKRKNNKKSIDPSHLSKKLTSAGKSGPKDSSESKNESSTVKSGNFIVLENPSTLWV